MKRTLTFILLACLFLVACGPRLPDLPPTPSITATPAPTKTPIPTPPTLGARDIMNIAFAAESLDVLGETLDIWEIEQSGSIVYVLVDISMLELTNDGEFSAWIDHLLGLVFAAAPYSDVIVGTVDVTNALGPDGPVRYYVITGILAYARTAIADNFQNPDGVIGSLARSGSFQPSSQIIGPEGDGLNELQGFDYTAQEAALEAELMDEVAPPGE